MTDPFVFEGEVRLLCQEGGFAEDAIVLGEDQGHDGLERLRALVQRGRGETVLATALEQHFGPIEHDRMGDGTLGKLRITVERIERAATGEDDGK